MNFSFESFVNGDFDYDKTKKIDSLSRRPIDFKKCLTATISIFLIGVWDYKSLLNIT